MEEFSKQWRGYNRLEVADYIQNLKKEIQSYQENIQALQDEI